MTPPLLHSRRRQSVSSYARHIYSSLARTRPLAPSNRRPTGPPVPPPAPGIWGDCGRSLGMLVYRSLGLWAALGVTYIIGLVAGPIAGPAVTSSLLVAAVTSLLTGFCYAELVTWSPQSSGHLYTATYQLVGEFVAYLLGILNVLFTASTLAAVCKALSATMDYMSGGKVASFVAHHIGRLPLTQTLPDFIAFGAALCVAVVLALGLEQSGFLRASMSVTSLAGLAFFLIVGGLHTEQNPAHLQRALHIESSELLAGAAICMVVYSSFYETGVRVKVHRRPQRALPLAISVSMGVTFLAFFALGIVLTLMTGNAIPPQGAPLLQALERRDVGWARLVMGSFQVVMMCLALVEAANPLSRQIVSLSADGLLPSALSHQCSHTTSYVYAHLAGGVLSSLLGLSFGHVFLLKVIATCVLCMHVIIITGVIYRRHRCTYGSLCSVAATASSSDPYSYHRLAPKHSRQERTLHFLKDGLRVLPYRVRPTKGKQSPSKSPDAESGISGLSPDNRDTAPLLENPQSEPCSPVHDLLLSPTSEANQTRSETQVIQKTPTMNTADHATSDSESGASGYGTDTDADEDIDAAVAAYQEKLRVATLDKGIPRAPTLVTARRACIALTILLVSVTVAAVVAVYGWSGQRNHTFQVVILVVSLVLSVLAVAFLTRLPTLRPGYNASFRVPASPWLPAAALFLNIIMLVQVLKHSWVVLLIYSLAGFLCYFTYSLNHSVLGEREIVTRRSPVSEVINLEPLTPPTLSPTLLQTSPQLLQDSAINPHFTRVTQVDTVLITR
ncbi:probable cationic amino acid transporter isoform X1 [Palaemon carinicauda]|uniref:probable cationic amino acid transporter isoform X1 n=1 Tax=Palaemon carinicauda TaxID=392227 RepID=UPI0035B66CE2